MAMRTAVRRWPAASSQVRALLQSGRQQQQTRAYAEEYTGNALNEKEKAAENRYIRQMEEEKKLKKALDGEPHATPEGAVPPIAEAVKTGGGFPTVAVVAGLVVAIGGYWLLSGSKKEEKESA